MERSYPTRAEFGLQVLLAEDAPENQRLLVLLLERLGCTVTLAGDGLEAVQHFDHASSDFDLVLLDMKMPVMDGFEAAETIRRRRPELAIVALTAVSQPEELEACRQAGCCSVLPKPVDRGQLYELLEQISSGLVPTAADRAEL